jgi:hypothetical protein
MDKDVVYYCLTLTSVSSLLWWLLITCILGMLISGGALLEIADFITDKKGINVSFFKLQTINRPNEMKTFLDGFSATGIKMFKKALVWDYAFMPFFYIALFSITSLLLRHSSGFTNGWAQFLSVLQWIPLMSWLFDIIENALSLSVLRNYAASSKSIGNGLVSLMYTGFVLKWFTLVGWAVCIVSFLISHTVG